MAPLNRQAHKTQAPTRCSRLTTATKSYWSVREGESLVGGREGVVRRAGSFRNRRKNMYALFILVCANVRPEIGIID
jgi:hypothetical protein